MTQNYIAICFRMDQQYDAMFLCLILQGIKIPNELTPLIKHNYKSMDSYLKTLMNSVLLKFKTYFYFSCGCGCE